MFQHFQCIHVLGSMKLTTFYHAYISYAMPSSGILQISYESLVFSWYDQENTSEKWNIPWYTTREHCKLCYTKTIENTLAKIHMGHQWKRIDVILWNIHGFPVF